MNHENKSQPQLDELPQASFDHATPHNEQNLSKAAEKPSAGAITSTQVASAQSSTASSIPQVGAVAANATALVSTPHIADEVQLIEKEWVESAKRIIEHTKDDPKKQSDGLGSVKTDYLKKRFNRDGDPLA